jgi:hypothetical protein
MNILKILLILFMFFYRPDNWFVCFGLMFGLPIIKMVYLFAEHKNYFQSNDDFSYWIGQMLFLFKFVFDKSIITVQKIHNNIKDTTPYKVISFPFVYTINRIDGFNRSVDQYLKNKIKNLSIECLCMGSEAIKSDPKRLDMILEIMNKNGQPNPFLNSSMISAMIPSRENIVEIFNKPESETETETKTGPKPNSRPFNLDFNRADLFEPEFQPQYSQMPNIEQLQYNLASLQKLNKTLNMSHSAPIQRQRQLITNDTKQLLSNYEIIELLQKLINKNKEIKNYVANDPELKTKNELSYKVLELDKLLSDSMVECLEKKPKQSDIPSQLTKPTEQSQLTESDEQSQTIEPTEQNQMNGSDGSKNVLKKRKNKNKNKKNSLLMQTLRDENKVN